MNDQDLLNECFILTVSQSRLDLAKFLVSQGADVMHRDQKALKISTFRADREFVDWLVQEGCTFDDYDYYSKTCENYYYSLVNIFEILFDYNVNPVNYDSLNEGFNRHNILNGKDGRKLIDIERYNKLCFTILNRYNAYLNLNYCFKNYCSVLCYEDFRDYGLEIFNDYIDRVSEATLVKVLKRIPDPKTFNNLLLRISNDNYYKVFKGRVYKRLANNKLLSKLGVFNRNDELEICKTLLSQEFMITNNDVFTICKFDYPELFDLLIDRVDLDEETKDRSFNLSNDRNKAYIRNELESRGYNEKSKE